MNGDPVHEVMAPSSTNPLTDNPCYSKMEEFRRTVAILNVKNLPDGLYRKLQARAKRQRRSVAQEVTQILSEALETPKALSILELRGLGKAHWQSVDAANHVERERSAWD